MPTAINFENVYFPTPGMFDIDANVTMTEGPSTLHWPAGLTPTAIQVDQSTTFTFKWNLTGMLASGSFGAGNLKIDVFYEPVSAGTVVLIPTTNVALTPTKLTGATATVDVLVTPGTVPQGIYRIVVRFGAYLAPAFLQPTSPACGFAELGLIEYYKG